MVTAELALWPGPIPAGAAHPLVVSRSSTAVNGEVASSLAGSGDRTFEPDSGMMSGPGAYPEPHRGPMKDAHGGTRSRFARHPGSGEERLEALAIAAPVP